MLSSDGMLKEGQMTKMKMVVYVLAIGVLVSLCQGAPAATGWRTDGTGRYPDSKPVMEWSVTNNVVWKTPTPAWGNANPVVVGDRVFIGMEKTKLLCISAKDGSVLWQKDTVYEDLGATPEEKAKITEDAKKMLEIQKEMKGVQKDLNDTAGELKKNKEDQTLIAKKDELDKKLAEVKERFKAYEQLLIPPTNKKNGYSTPTPVSDGQCVYVMYGTGVATCFDLNGNRKWTTMIGKPTDDRGISASPVVVGNMFAIQVVDLSAVDKSSGQLLWRTKTKKHQQYGSIVSARVGDTDVIICPAGEVVRASDGKILANELFALTYGAPVVCDNVIYGADEGNAFAVKLPETLSETVKPEVLWKKKITKERHYSSPVVHDGIFYTLNQKGVLMALDAKNGDLIYEKPVEGFAGKGTTYPSLVLAGGRLFVSIDSGLTAVVEPGREFKIAGTNMLEGFRASPVLSGDRIFIRALKFLYCIGASGK
jgi:hypothetical protein